MTKKTKQITIGTVATLAALAIPVTAVVSCGAKAKDDISVNKSFKAQEKYFQWYNSMSLTWASMNAVNGTHFNSHVENFSKAEKLAKKHGWKKLYSTTIDLKTKPNRIKISKDINAKIKVEFDKLNALHKRTLVFAGTDIDSQSTTIVNKYEIAVYDTLSEKDTKLSQKFGDYINLFLNSSNTVSKDYLHDADLDKLKPKTETAEQYSTKRYLSASRSLRTTTSGKPSYTSDWAFVDNGLLTDKNSYNKFISEAESKKLLDKKAKVGTDVATMPVFDSSKANFSQRTTFFEDANFDNANPSLTAPKTKKIFEGGGAPYYDDFKTVFTISPLIQNLKSTKHYKFNPLSDKQLIQYVLTGHKTLIKLTEFFGGMAQGLEMLRKVLPSSSPFISSNMEWLSDLDEMKIKAVKIGKNTSEERANYISNNIEKFLVKNMSKAREAIKKSGTTTEERIAYSYNRDYSDSFIKAIIANSDDPIKVSKFTGDYKKQNDKIINSLDLQSVASGGLNIITLLFDYVNTFSAIGDVLHKSYEASKTTPAPNVYK